MRIKNWFVRSVRVKDRHNGLIKYAKYLTDQSHPNHANTSGIMPIYGNVEEIIKAISSEAIMLDMKNAQGKGGRPVQSYAQSFVFVLPPSVPKPTDEQWKLITKDIIKDLAVKLEISPHLLNKKVFANVHDQDNPHLNVLIPRVIDGKSLKALDQKGTISVAKKSFTAATLNHCGLDVSKYEPLQTNLGKRQEKWKLQEQQAINAIKNMEKKGSEIESRIDEKVSSAVKKLSDIGKFWGMLNNQVLKWINAVQEKDEKQEKRQENRIYKTLESAEILGIPPEQVEIIDELFDNAEEKTGKKLERRYKNRI